MLLAVSRDITDIHHQQQEIQSLNETLESRVALRTQELAQANHQLSEALDHAKRLYNQAPCGYHSVNEQGMVISVNQTALDWFGLTEEAVVGRLNFMDFVHPDFLHDAGRTLPARQAQRSRGAGGSLRPASDGSEMWVLVSTTAAVDAEGRFLHTHNSMVDVTARHLAEEALASQRRFLQTISNSVPVQLGFYDRDLICRFANASYARWLNGDPQSLVGRHLRDIAKPKDFEQGLPHLESALVGISQRFEGERTFPDGHRFYASIEYTPYVENGAGVGPDHSDAWTSPNAGRPRCKWPKPMRN